MAMNWSPSLLAHGWEKIPRVLPGLLKQMGVPSSEMMPVLMSFACIFRDRKIRVTAKKLADLAGCSKSVATRALKRMEQLDFVDRTRRGMPGACSVYEIRQEFLTQLDTLLEEDNATEDEDEESEVSA